MPYSSSPTPSATASVSPSVPAAANPSVNNASTEAVVGCLVVAAAFSVTLLAMGYKRYRAAQRSRLLKRQIAMLEAMWRISSTK